MSISKIWQDAVRTVVSQTNQQSRNGMTKEVLGFQCKLENVDSNFIVSTGRKLSPIYASAELLWYLSGTDDVEMISAYAPSYVKYANNGKVFGAYGHRWKNDFSFRHHSAYHDGVTPESQLFAAIECLQNDKDSRQAVITQWNGGDIIHAIAKDKNDLPCTISLQFMVRNNQVLCFVNMRSNDLWMGFPYDVYCFSTIQRLVADELGLACGEYYHQAASEHLYEVHWNKAKDAANEVLDFKKQFHYYVYNIDFYKDLFLDVRMAVDMERAVRKGEPVTVGDVMCIERPILRDAVLCCGVKFGREDFIPKIHSELLAEHING